MKLFKPRSLWTLVSVALATFFSRIYLFRLSLPYENGRFFDANEGVVYEQQSLAVYGVLALLFIATSLFLIIKFYKDRRHDRTNSYE